MAIKKSVAVRNAELNALETVVGASPVLQIRSGAPPASAAAADAGVLLCEIDLPADWAADAENGEKVKSGTWQGAGVAAGNAGHFRLKDSTGATTHYQGTISATGGGGDMTLDNVSIAVDQQVTVNTFTRTAAGA